MGVTMKKISLLLMLVILIQVVSALDECGFSVPINNTCSIITPITSCTTIDILNSSGALFVDDGILSQIGTTGIYNYSVEFLVPDTYIVNLCNEASRSIIALDLTATTPSASWWSYILQIFYQTLPGAW